jgi:hypothetical protein
MSARRAQAVKVKYGDTEVGLDLEPEPGLADNGDLMAERGPGLHRSGDIADELGRKVTSLGSTRSQLIAKGMIWSPNHGDTAFTVPLFDEFLRRIMPSNDWRE